MNSFLARWVGAATLALAMLAGCFSACTAAAKADDGDLTLSAHFTKAAGDKPAELVITAEIPDGYHTYSITQKAGGPLSTKIKPAASNDFRITGDFKADPAPSVRYDKDLYGDLPLEEHSGKVTWRAPIELASGVDPAKLVIKGTVKAQRCTDKNCLPPKSYPFEATLATPPDQKPSGKAPASDHASDAALITAAAGATVFTSDSLHATVRGAIEPAVAAPGSVVNLTIYAQPQPGYHVYSYQDHDPQDIGVGKPTLIAMTDTAGLRYKSPEPQSPPKDVPTPDGTATMHIYDQPIHWTIPIEIPATAKPGEYPIHGLLGIQTCSDQQCDLPQAAEFAGVIKVGQKAGDGASALTFERTEYNRVAKAAEQSLTHGSRASDNSATSSAAAPLSQQSGPPRSTGGNGPSKASAAPATEPPRPPDTLSLPVVLMFSLLGGLILNLMPCVLPVIGLKILSFVEQGGKSGSHVFALNLWYSLGLLSVFMVLATLAAFAGLAWGQHFQSQPFNIALSALVFVMAISFIGVWEIPIPGFVGSGKSVELASREGAIGAFAKGAFTTVLATPCSGPFLGAVFGYTLNRPPAIIYLIFGCIGLGMASPYLLIGAAPRLIRFLPRPGMWMETFKQAMGFVLLGTVVYLFTIIKPEYIVPTFAMLVGLWAGCWWIGRTPVTAEANRKTASWLIGLGVAGAVGAFAFTVLVPGPAELTWQPFSPADLARLQRQNKTVLLDFTAVWCPTCKANLALAIDTHAVRKLVDDNGVVPLKADWSDPSDEIKNTLHSLNSDSIPLLAIFPAGQPDQPIILRDAVTQQQVLDALAKAGPSHAEPVAQAADAAAAPLATPTIAKRGAG